ncbi:MAG TPA: (Na+)-NQR maturation NqrM [Porticoccus sp.]|nr:(Na+)-NQR maturation NqrM [Porticoccus sp.]
MELFLAFVVLLLIMAGMAIGVIMGRKPLKGSCGGVGAALGEKDYTCDLCGDDPNKCEEISQGNSQNKAGDLAYDATKEKRVNRQQPTL